IDRAVEHAGADSDRAAGTEVAREFVALRLQREDVAAACDLDTGILEFLLELGFLRLGRVLVLLGFLLRLRGLLRGGLRLLGRWFSDLHGLLHGRIDRLSGRSRLLGGRLRRYGFGGL